jgi:UDP-2,3-diacylglucosamine pyrophosphatase LpxH
MFREEEKKQDRTAQLTALLDKALVDNNIDVEDVRDVTQVKVKQWQMGSKDAEGNPQVTNLEGYQFTINPKWAAGPEWPAIEPARPVIIRMAKVKKPAHGYKTAVIVPDPQIGFYRDIETDAFMPFHDERAMDIVLQVIRDLQPDLIVNLGDLLDFAEFGKYEQTPTFQRTAQKTIDRAHLFLAQQKAAAPDSHIVLIEGNHDRRLQKATINNMAAAFGISQARIPDSWTERLPVLSVPHLLRLEELGVEYVSGYPAAAYWINDRLKCIHGATVVSRASTARRVSDDERVSAIFGHVHRIELQYKTVNVRDGSRINLAFTPGCLCHIDGRVPSTKGSTDYLGRPVQNYENWQQGFGVVDYEEGDGMFNISHAFIHEGQAIFRGNLYVSDETA